MEEVVGQVITDVAEDAAAENGSCGIPVVEEYRMRQLPERGRKDQEESRRHHKTVLVHGQVVMDAMEQEMERDADPVVGQISVITIQ